MDAALDLIVPSPPLESEAFPVEIPVSGGKPSRGVRQRPCFRNRIFVRNLQLQARIGVYAWEKTSPQPLVLDIECALPSSMACYTDRLENTVDYGAMVERLRVLALERHCDLVEAMAESMANIIRFEFGVPWLRLTLTKTAPIPGVEVGITIERGDQDYGA